MKLVIKKPSSLNKSILDRLKQLRLKDGVMYWELLAAIKIPEMNSRVILCYDDDKIIGWSLIQERNYYPRRRYKYLDIGVFVHRNYRRKHVGIKIVNKAKCWAKRNTKTLEIIAHPYDWKTACFFDRCGLWTVSAISFRRKD
jgi:GNAT superfamily N-acetyltransferase